MIDNIAALKRRVAKFIGQAGPQSLLGMDQVLLLTRAEKLGHMFD